MAGQSAESLGTPLCPPPPLGVLSLRWAPKSKSPPLPPPSPPTTLRVVALLMHPPNPARPHRTARAQPDTQRGPVRALCCLWFSWRIPIPPSPQHLVHCQILPLTAVDQPSTAVDCQLAERLQLLRAVLEKACQLNRGLSEHLCGPNRVLCSLRQRFCCRRFVRFRNCLVDLQCNNDHLGAGHHRRWARTASSPHTAEWSFGGGGGGGGSVQGGLSSQLACRGGDSSTSTHIANGA